MKEIWQFLTVLLAGVLAALLLVVWMVRGGEEREERIYAHQALLSPATIETMGNRAVRLDRGEGSSSYLIEAIRFSFFNTDSKKWEERVVDIGPYTQFFNQIEGDRGELNSKEEFQGKLPKLTFVVKERAAGSTESHEAVFQTLEFSPSGNMYRIDLRFDQAKREWVYFTHPGVLSYAMEILKR